MKGYGGPAQPSLTLGAAINGRYRYLEVNATDADTVDLTISGRPKETPIWQLEQRKRCNPCSAARLRL